MQGPLTIPEQIDLLLKLAIFDTPEEVFRYLKRRKLIYPGSLLAASQGAAAYTLHPKHPVVTMPAKQLLAEFYGIPRPELKKEVAFLQRIKKLGKPGILMGAVPSVPRTLTELDPLNRLIMLHELGHAQTALRHPKLFRFFTKFTPAGVLHEYFTHRKALKWLKAPLPELTTWELRYPSLQAISHFQPVRKHILPVLDYIQLKRMLKNPRTAKLVRPHLKSPQFTQMLSQIGSPRIRSWYRGLVESAYRRAPRSVKPSFVRRIGQRLLGFLKR